MSCYVTAAWRCGSAVLLSTSLMAYGKSTRGKPARAAPSSKPSSKPVPSFTNPNSHFSKPVPAKKDKRDAKRQEFMKRLKLPGDSIGKDKPRYGLLNQAPKLAPKPAVSAIDDLLSSVSNIQFSFPGFSTATPFVPVSALPVEPEKPKPVSNKPAISKANRKKLAAQEIAQFSAVLSHPSFRSDALSAVREHLSNTQAQAEAKEMEKVEFQKSVQQTFKAAHRTVAAKASEKAKPKARDSMQL